MFLMPGERMQVDERRFDAALRALHMGATRRKGLAAAASVLLGSVGVGVARAMDDAAHGSLPATVDGPAEAGPCGDGSPRDNRCQRNVDCCTGSCVDGACRCKPNWAICSRDAQCCGRSCAGGRCDGGCRSRGARCEEQFNCCTGMICEQGVCVRSRSAVCSGKNCDGCCDGTTCRPGSEDD
ncbi:MAG: hypothetical protein ACR2J8_14870, partial [Thermomicrobiales bacterium]